MSTYFELQLLLKLLMAVNNVPTQSKRQSVYMYYSLARWPIQDGLTGRLSAREAECAMSGVEELGLV